MADGLILTDVGAAKIEAAYEAGEVIVITMASFGDGGGSDVIADPSVTELVSMIGTAPLAADSSGEMFIGGTVVIRCEDYPGSVVREFGLESEDGTLIAYTQLT